METIEIDFDVFKALTLRRKSEDVSYNDVLRELLGLDPTKAPTQPGQSSDSGAWVTKGVTFPEGTEFRGKHKGRTFTGKVESGALVVNGERYDSPSAAAVTMTGKSTNGWLFWECRLPGKTSWQIITSFRK